MAAQRARSLLPLTRTLVSVPRSTLPLSFNSLPLSSSSSSSPSAALSLRSFASSPSPLLQASASSPSPSHDSHGHAEAGAGGHGGHHSSEDRSGPDYGIHFHEPARWHKVGAQFFGGLMWFWLLYRLKNDWRYLFFWDNPFDSHDEHHPAGADAHGEAPADQDHH